MQSGVPVAFRTCVRREPRPGVCTPRGFEWIPGYLNQYGGQLTDYGRNWLLDKWAEAYTEALEDAEREYQACLKGGVKDSKSASGMVLHVLSGLDASTARSVTTPTLALRSPVEVRFAPKGSTPPPCDPFDPDAPVYLPDPNAPPVSVPRSVFWKSASATYDLDALRQAMQPVNGNLNPDNPLSLRDLRLSAEGVKGAVVFLGHRFLPMPAQVRAYEDVRVLFEVASIRLDVTAEWARNGAVLNEWSAVSVDGAYTDFQCYYFGCAWWASPPPVFDWGLVAPGCIEDLVFRALPTAITYIRVSAATGASLGNVTLSITNVGTIDSRPIVAQHRIFNSPGTPQFVLPQVDAGPATLGVTVERNVVLPDCLAGKVELAPDSSQDFNLFQQDGVINVSVVAGTAPGTFKLRLTLLRHVYHWDRDVDIRFVPLGGIDVGYPTSGWFPHVVARVPVSWNGCYAFQPDRDSQARVVSAGWSVADTYSTPLRWLHQLQLRVVDYAPPEGVACGAFDCVWGYMRVTWPDGTVQTQQIMCVAGDIDVPRTFTLRMAGNAAPTVNVELELHYEASNRRRRADGTDFDTLPVPGPAITHQTLTP